MKFLEKVLLVLICPIFVHAQIQQQTLDSFHKLLGNASNDSLRMDAYDSLAYFYIEADNDSAYFYINKELILTRQLDLKINEAAALKTEGYILSGEDNYTESLDKFTQALKLAEDPASEKKTWHLEKGQTPREQRLTCLGWIFIDQSRLYRRNKLLDKAIASVWSAKVIADSIHYIPISAYAYDHLAQFCVERGKIDSALFYVRNAKGYFLNSDEIYKGNFINFLAQLYQRSGKLDSSAEAFRLAIAVNKKANNITSLGDSYLWLAQLYQEENRTDSGLSYALKAAEAYRNSAYQEGLDSAYRLLSSLYHDKDLNGLAYSYLRMAAAITDSIDAVDRKNMLGFQSKGFAERLNLEELQKEKIQTQTQIRTYALLAGIGILMIIASLLLVNNRNRKKANGLLQKQKKEIEIQNKNVEAALSDLKSTQQQLIQSEKMASLGELTAGIAHEIQNPLNFVNNFSEVNKELIDELTAERQKAEHERNITLENEILSDIRDNEEKINHHGKRADAIVKGMLQHSRTNAGQMEPTDINALADEYLRLSYHGLRAKDKSFNSILDTDFDSGIGKVNIIAQDMGRLLLNLYNNAFYAVNEKSKLGIQGYDPTVSVSTKNMNDKVEIRVTDNGNGIPQKVVDKIFQPFFTTKPTGQGTGLGLSLSYDIVKAHGGEIKAETKEGEGSEFIIQLPINA
jgi:two-component system, NtrC family, sensor kinase